MPSSAVRYHLSRHVSAVRLEEHPGSSLRNPTSILVEIPVGATVELEGGVGLSGLATVLWDGTAYSVFYEDLKENAKPVTA